MSKRAVFSLIEVESTFRAIVQSWNPDWLVSNDIVHLFPELLSHANAPDIGASFRYVVWNQLYHKHVPGEVAGAISNLLSNFIIKCVTTIDVNSNVITYMSFDETKQLILEFRPKIDTVTKIKMEILSLVENSHGLPHHLNEKIRRLESLTNEL